MTKLPVAAGLALALAAGSAFAADLPSYKAPPPPPPPPMFSWTGLYGGVNIGYGFGDGTQAVGAQLFRSGTFITTAFENVGPAWSLANDLNGVTGGGQIGFNYQFNPWLVVGFEADIQASDIRARTNAVIPFPGSPGFGPSTGFTNTSQYVDWWGTLRGRLGLTMPSWPNLMLYGTGGFAYAAVNSTFNYGTVAGLAGVPGVAFAANVYDDTKFGWTAGGGVEWSPMSFPSWSLKVEYLYVDVGNISQSALGFGVSAQAAGLPPMSVAGTQSIATRWHTVRAGLNWHFNPFAAAPVLAKY